MSPTKHMASHEAFYIPGEKTGPLPRPEGGPCTLEVNTGQEPGAQGVVHTASALLSGGFPDPSSPPSSHFKPCPHLYPNPVHWLWEFQTCIQNSMIVTLSPLAYKGVQHNVWLPAFSKCFHQLLSGTKVVFNLVPYFA